MTTELVDTGVKYPEITSPLDGISNDICSKVDELLCRRKAGKMIEELLSTDISGDDNLVVSRDIGVFNYLRRINHRLILDGVKGIYFGRDEKKSTYVDDIGSKQEKVSKPKINKNKALVRDYFDRDYYSMVDRLILSFPGISKSEKEKVIRKYEGGEPIGFVGNFLSFLLSKGLIPKDYRDAIDESIPRSREKVHLNLKFEHKLGRYYQMYEVPIARRLQRDLREHNGTISNSDFHNYMVNILNEVLYLLFAFGDSINPDDFEKMLMGRGFYLKKDLDSEDEQEDSDSAIHESIIGFTGKIVDKYEDLSEYPDLLNMYKHFVSNGLQYQENGRINFSNSRLKSNIVKHFGDSFESIGDIFKHWFYSTKPEPNKLKLIYDELHKIPLYVKILKEKDIAFSEISYENLHKDLLDKYDKEIRGVLTKKLEYDIFKDIFMADLQDNDYYGKLMSLCNIVRETRSEDLLKIEFEDIEYTEISDLKFSSFSRARPDVRKKYFLEKVLGVKSKGGDIPKTNNIPKIDLENERIFNAFINFYAYRYSGHGLTEENVRSMFLKALDLINSGISLEEFEKHNLECEQLLIAWYRFYLLYKGIHDDLKDIDIKKIMKEELDGMHGTRELVSMRLEREGVSGNIQILPSSKVDNDRKILKNSSEFGFGDQLNRHKKRFTHRPVDLDNKKDYGYVTGDGKNVLFKNNTDFYLPKNGDDYKGFIKGFINICDLILQKRLVDHTNNYLPILESNGITKSNVKAIWNLRRFLKYILYIIPILENMQEKSDLERDFLNNNISKFGISLEVGPKKGLRRVLEKAVKNYNGDITDLGDLARGRNVSETFNGSIENLVSFLKRIKEDREMNKYIEQVIIGDNTGHPSGRSDKATGYRDITLTLKTKSGGLIEIQFINEKIFRFKEEGLLSKDLIDIYKEDGIKIEPDEVTELENTARSLGLKIPREFKFIYSGDMELDLSAANDDLYDQGGGKVNSDFFYQVSRSTKLDSLKTKFQRMEYLPNLKAWGEVVYAMNDDIFEQREAA